jgi:hypothetical protein
MAVQDPREVARLRGYSGVSKAAETVKSGDDQKPKQQSKAESKESKTPTLRYPLKRIDDSSDYLCISVLDYVPVGLQIESKFQQVKTENGNYKLQQSVKEDTFKDVNQENQLSKLSVQSTPAADRIKKKAEGFVYLPIPQNIQDTTSVTWGEDSLDPLSAFGLSFGADALKDPGQAIRDYLSLGSQALKDLSADANAQNALTAVIAGQAFGALGGNVSTSGLVARASGQIFNPNMELLFQGVNIRSFSFNFNFVARSSKEGDEIKKIIRYLKKSMTPSNSSNSGTKGIFIKSPKIFQLEYRKGNKKHPFLNSFLPMALTNVSVNYTGSNTYSTYYDGTPVHLTMQLDFQELNPLYTEDYTDKIPGVGY